MRYKKALCSFSIMPYLFFQNETYITETLSMTRPLQEKGATSHKQRDVAPSIFKREYTLLDN